MGNRPRTLSRTLLHFVLLVIACSLIAVAGGVSQVRDGLERMILSPGTIVLFFVLVLVPIIICRIVAGIGTPLKESRHAAAGRLAETKNGVESRLHGQIASVRNPQMQLEAILGNMVEESSSSIISIGFGR